MKKTRVFKKTFYCGHCGSKMVGVCLDPIYDHLTGKPIPYLYTVKCPKSAGDDIWHTDGVMHSNGTLGGR